MSRSRRKANSASPRRSGTLPTSARLFGRLWPGWAASPRKSSTEDGPLAAAVYGPPLDQAFLATRERHPVVGPHRHRGPGDVDRARDDLPFGPGQAQDPGLAAPLDEHEPRAVIEAEARNPVADESDGTAWDRSGIHDHAGQPSNADTPQSGGTRRPVRGAEERASPPPPERARGTDEPVPDRLRGRAPARAAVRSPQATLAARAAERPIAEGEHARQRRDPRDADRAPRVEQAPGGAAVLGCVHAVLPADPAVQRAGEAPVLRQRALPRADEPVETRSEREGLDAADVGADVEPVGDDRRRGVRRAGDARLVAPRSAPRVEAEERRSPVRVLREPDDVAGDRRRAVEEAVTDLLAPPHAPAAASRDVDAD